MRKYNSSFQKLLKNIISIATITISDEFSTGTVAFNIDGHLFTLKVTPQGFIGNCFGPFFRSTTCSGTPYIACFDPGSFLFPLVAINAPALNTPGEGVWITDPKGTPVELNLNPPFEPITTFDTITGSCE